MDILPFSPFSVVSLFLYSCLYLFIILVLHLACNAWGGIPAWSLLVQGRSPSAKTFKHEISASNRWGGFGRDGQLMPTDANVSSAQELKIGSTHRKWFRLIQPLRANWSLWELGKLNFTSACLGESWKNPFICQLAMINSTKRKMKDRNHTRLGWDNQRE